MSMSVIQCPRCMAHVLKATGGVNRSRRAGMPVYCGRECAGLARRKWKSKAQKVEEKRVYDEQYRAKNLETLKAKKRIYHERTYDPVKAAEARKLTMPRHIEYCRQPEYRAWKRDYDRQYRAAKEYGEFADCFLLVMDIRAECLSQMSDYEIRYAKGGFGKTQQRKRDHVRTLREEPQVGPLGHVELRQGRQNGSLAG